MPCESAIGLVGNGGRIAPVGMRMSRGAVELALVSGRAAQLSQRRDIGRTIKSPGGGKRGGGALTCTGGNGPGRASKGRRFGPIGNGSCAAAWGASAINSCEL